MKRPAITLPLHGLSLGELNDKVFEAFRFGHSEIGALMPLLTALLESDEEISWEVRHELAAAIRRGLTATVPGRPSIELRSKGTRTVSALAPQIKLLSDRLAIGARVAETQREGPFTRHAAISKILRLDYPTDAESLSSEASDRLEKRREKIRKAAQYYVKMQKWLMSRHPAFYVFNQTQDDHKMAFIMDELARSHPALISAEVAYLEDLQNKADASAISNLRKTKRGI